MRSFNEAAGIHRRKLPLPMAARPPAGSASMRPPEFTGGNSCRSRGPASVPAASMRPPEFTGGNARLGCAPVPSRAVASMRPPEFTGGNRPTPSLGDAAAYVLSCESLEVGRVKKEAQAPSGGQYTP